MSGGFGQSGSLMDGAFGKLRTDKPKVPGHEESALGNAEHRKLGLQQTSESNHANQDYTRAKENIKLQ